MPLRDVALTLLLLAAIPTSTIKPYIGALFFAWLSLMNPHRLTWGFAYDFSWAQYVAAATLLGYLFAKEKLLGDSVTRYRVPLLYLLWTCITTIFALDQSASLVRLNDYAKIHLMCLVTLALLTTQKRVDLFVFVATLSVAFYGIKGGIFTLQSGGNFRVWGPEGSVIYDNNQLAVALVMTLPLVFWMASYVTRRWVKYLTYAALVLIAAAILGTHSRGAVIGASAMALFLVLKSQRRLEALMIVGIVAAIAAFFMPQEFWDRVASIAEYEDDQSAQGRLYMWEAALNIANHRVTGGGFNSYAAPSYHMYAANGGFAYHSIYFQALGDHGWLGLMLFVGFFISVWRQAGATIRSIAGSPENQHIAQLLRMVQVSLIGYAAGGAFVNIGYWDYPYYLALAVLAIARLHPTPAKRWDRQHSDRFANPVNERARIRV